MNHTKPSPARDLLPPQTETTTHSAFRTKYSAQLSKYFNFLVARELMAKQISVRFIAANLGRSSLILDQPGPQMPIKKSRLSRESN